MCKGTNIFVQLCTICRILITRSDVAIIFVPYCKGSSAYTYISIDAGTRKGTLGMAIINKGKTKPVTSVDVTALPPTEVAGKTSEQGF